MTGRAQLWSLGTRAILGEYAKYTINDTRYDAIDREHMAMPNHGSLSEHLLFSRRLLRIHKSEPEH